MLGLKGLEKEYDARILQEMIRQGSRISPGGGRDTGSTP
jgi:hypothetical protein